MENALEEIYWVAVQAAITCPEDHMLALTEGSQGEWRCDLCFGMVRKGTEAVWRCLEDERQGRGGSGK